MEEQEFVSLDEARKISEEKTAIVADDLRQKLKDTDKKIDRMEERIAGDRNRTIETLGVFVALFTFISVEFQAFSQLSSPKDIGGITLILLGGLLSFITLLDLVVNERLSLTKTKKIVGTLDRMVARAARQTGSSWVEDVPFKFCEWRTWPNGYRLLVIWLAMIAWGVLLLIL